MTKWYDKWFKTQGEWKIEQTIAIDLMSFKDSKYSNETPNMHARSNNIEIMIGNETDGIIEEIFAYQEWLENQWKEVNLFLLALIYCITNFIK